MAIVMLMHWPEVTQDQYDAVRKDIDWMTNRPPGGMFHISYFADDGFHVVDVWESAEAFQAFSQDKLSAATAKVGLKTAPDVKIFPAHTVDPVGFNPK